MGTPKEKTKVLILTSSTGGGHNARANALSSWFRKLHPENTEVRTEKLLENSSWVGKVGVKFYNWIYLFVPPLHYIYWPIIEAVGQFNRLSLGFGKKYYEATLREFRPNIIISVHDFLNYGYFEIAKKVLGEEKVKCITYCGEFSGGFGYSINWTNPRTDLFIARNSDALKHAHRLGIKKENSISFLSLLGPEEFESQFSDNERRSFRKNTLNLDADKFTVFFATGNNGQNNHIRFLEILKEYSAEVQGIAICGRNKSSYDKLVKWKEANPQFSLYLEGYSNQVHKLIQASDVIVTRGGADTAAKALHYGCPILFNCTKGKMPQEHLTINFFIKNDTAYILKKNNDFKDKIESWKNFGREYKHVLKNMHTLRSKDEDPAQLIKSILELDKDLEIKEIN